MWKLYSAKKVTIKMRIFEEILKRRGKDTKIGVFVTKKERLKANNL
jgi:hypothetical protein